LADYGAKLYLQDPNRPLFESQKGGHFSANTMCQLFLDIYKAVGLKDASSHSGAVRLLWSFLSSKRECAPLNKYLSRRYLLRSAVSGGNENAERLSA
jgi:integrase/recombinase XerD